MAASGGDALRGLTAFHQYLPRRAPGRFNFAVEEAENNPSLTSSRRGPKKGTPATRSTPTLNQP